MNRKERIRIMLEAEGLLPGLAETPRHAAWKKLRNRLGHEPAADSIPPLEIIEKSGPAFRYLPLAAIATLAIGLAGFWLLRPYLYEQTGNRMQAVSGDYQTLIKGSVLRRNRRTISVLNGQALLSERPDGSFKVNIAEGKLRFRLKEKTDLVVEHRLLQIFVTGTEFDFDATKTTGTVTLTEGRLLVHYRGKYSADYQLVAPAVFKFDLLGAKKQAAVPSAVPRRLYRFDLADGETFFGWPVVTRQAMQSIDVLGGGRREIPITEIVRQEPAEAE